jgi:hypothetical protein
MGVADGSAFRWVVAMDFQVELAAVLEKNRIEYDERYVWG